MRTQQQRMVVLGLLSIGMRYGWEMEKFAAETAMRRWTPIGMSTIYKLLKDLARDDVVHASQEEGGKGPARVAYSLTKKGHREFQRLVAQALRSDASVYSERMAGLVFLPTVDSPIGIAAINEADAWLEKADELLAEQSSTRAGDVIADALIGFYRDVYVAERSALAKVKRLLKTRKGSQDKPEPSNRSGPVLKRRRASVAAAGRRTR